MVDRFHVLPRVGGWAEAVGAAAVSSCAGGHPKAISTVNLWARQQKYNKVHSFDTARSEHIFACSCPFKIVRGIWTRGSTHDNVRMTVRFMQFQIRCQTRYQPYGRWEHVPDNIWTDEASPDPKEDVDDTYLCQLCCHRCVIVCTMLPLPYLTPLPAPYLTKSCMGLDHAC